MDLRSAGHRSRVRHHRLPRPLRRRRDGRRALPHLLRVVTPRRTARAGLRAAALVAIAAVCMGAWRVEDVLARAPERRWRARCRWFGRWARATVRLLGVRVTVHGRPPPPPFLLVCNHLGYLDVPVLAALVDAAFVAKAEVDRWPV